MSQKKLVKDLIARFLKQAMDETDSDELSIAALRIFLTIPDTASGIAQTQLTQALSDVSNTTVSRHIAFLAALPSAHRKSPLATPLVETAIDPVDRRYRYIKLTQAGVALQDRLVEEFLKRLVVNQ